MTSPAERSPAQGNLPRVTREATVNAGLIVQRLGWAAFRAQSLDTLRNENPELLKGLEQLRDGTSFFSSEMRKDFFTAAALMTHAMLAEQAKIDDPKKDESRYRLPVVGADTAPALIADLCEQGSLTMSLGANDRIIAENEHLVSSVWLFIQGTGANDVANSAAYAGMQHTYSLLSRQADADALRAQVFGPPPQEQ